MDQKGEGFSKYKDIYINRFKKNHDNPQGIFFTIKNIKTKKIWSSNYLLNENKEEQYQILCQIKMNKKLHLEILKQQF